MADLRLVHSLLEQEQKRWSKLPHVEEEQEQIKWSKLPQIDKESWRQTAAEDDMADRRPDLTNLGNPSHQKNRQDVQEKVITHLLRQFQARNKVIRVKGQHHTRRAIDRGEERSTPSRARHLTEQVPAQNLFTCYSDTGEKFRGQRTESKALDGPSQPQIAHRQTHGAERQTSRTVSVLREALNHKTASIPVLQAAEPLPHIGNTGLITSSTISGCNTDGLDKASVIDDHNPRRSRNSHGMPDRTRDLVEDVLSGRRLQKESPPDTSRYLYVVSGSSDMQTELTYLQQRLYPQLRRHFRQRGLDLNIVDLHWGFKDMIADDHDFLGLSRNIISRMTKTGGSGINFLLLLGQKYGSSCLPSSMSQNMMEHILQAASEFRHSQENKVTLLETGACQENKMTSSLPETGACQSEIGDQTLVEEKELPSKELSTTQASEDHPHVPPEEGKTHDSSSVSTEQHHSQTTTTDQDVTKVIKENQMLPDLNLLYQWYRLDENAVPAMFRLQDISTVYKDMIKNDPHKRQSAKLSFAAVETKLTHILRTFGTSCIQEQGDLENWTSSVVEHEVEKSLQQRSSLCHVTAVVRTIEDLLDKVDQPVAGDFLDLLPGGQPCLDQEKWDRMEKLRHRVQQICRNQVSTQVVQWAAAGISQSEHGSYLERVSTTVFDQVTGCPGVAGDSSWHESESWRTQLWEEVVEHLYTCQKWAGGFQGQENILAQIKSYLNSNTGRPLILHGGCGSGKSAILATVTTMLEAWFTGEDQRCVLVRVVGCTMSSKNIQTLLRDISRQLCCMLGVDIADVPADYKGLVNDLPCRLQAAASHHPVVVIIDGLDNLSDEYDGTNLLWLPCTLPPSVHMILSVSSEDKLNIFSTAKKLLPDSSFLEVGPFPEEDSRVVLRRNLQAAGRTLTEKQLEIVFSSLRKNPTPLFLKLCYHEAVKWSSYSTPKETQLGDTVKCVLTSRFSRLEHKHGETLTRRALGYLTCSRSGLTSNEMEDILSLDEAVMDEVMTFNRLPLRRLPGLLWARLQEELTGLTGECRVGGARTTVWAHPVIKETAKERYLTQKDKAASFHKTFVEYFSGTWAGKLKPQISLGLATDRLVTDQELFTEIPGSNEQGCRRVYNVRKLFDLPFHMRQCQMLTQMKQACLFNYDWMLARLCSSSVESLLQEYGPTQQPDRPDPELDLLVDTLLLSRSTLERTPQQLAGQLVGRLHKIVTADNPQLPGDPRRFPNLHHLLTAARHSSSPTLIPSVECLIEPGGLLSDLLSGHLRPLTAITVTSDGVHALTTSEDGTLKLWDIQSRTVTKSIMTESYGISSVRAAKGNTVAVTAEGPTVKIWDLSSGVCTLTINQYVDPASVSLSGDGNILVVVYDSSNVFQSWSLATLSMVCQTNFLNNSVHKDRALLVSETFYEDRVLIAARSSNKATSLNALNGKPLKTLQCNQKTSAIVTVASSTEYFILCCRQQVLGQLEIHSLELFDPAKGTYIRSVRGCAQDHIRNLTLNSAQSHAIAASFNLRSGTSDIALFNLETEEHKHLAHHPGVTARCACLEFRFCLTSADGDKCPRVWNLSSLISQQMPKPKKLLGILDIWPMVDNPRYVVAKATNNGPISVWNVSKGKCLQSAVRIERGLTEGTDALVIRNTRLVILTDRALSDINQEPVFKTVLVYELKLKKYVRKLTGCYIVPAPSHEFTLLDNETLLGPSDNRSHFVAWSLVTGMVSFRVKTAFKELELRLLQQEVHKGSDHRARKRSSAWKSSQENPVRVRSRPSTRKLPNQVPEVDTEMKKERDNLIDQFLISADQTTLVASFYAHHLCVFDLLSHRHVQTLQTNHSMMFLHSAALTFNGSHLVHANYDEINKTSYVTLWNCTLGTIRKRLKGERNVCAVAITDDAMRILIGRANNELHVWDPMTPNSLRRIRGYPGFRFQMRSKMRLVQSGRQAVVWSGDVSVWDLVGGSLLAVFSPDSSISVCDVILDGRLVVVGLYDKLELVVLQMSSHMAPELEDTAGLELFGETTGDTSEEEEEEEGEKERKEGT